MLRSKANAYNIRRYVPEINQLIWCLYYCSQTANVYDIDDVRVPYFTVVKIVHNALMFNVSR